MFLYLSSSNKGIALRRSEGRLVTLLAGRLLDRETLLVDLEVPLLPAAHVVGVVDESVLELAGYILLFRFRNFVHARTVLLATSRELEGRARGFGAGLVLYSRKVHLLHGLQLHFLVLTAVGLPGVVAHFIEGVDVPLRVLEELVDVLAEHFFKIAVPHADGALL